MEAAHRIIPRNLGCGNSCSQGCGAVITPAPKGGGEKHRCCPLGCAATSGNPNTPIFSSQQNQEWKREEQRGLWSPQTHRQAKPPACKDDASFAHSQLPIQQRKQEPWDQHTQQFACIFIPGLCRQQEKLTEGSSSRANIWREMHREFRGLC